MDDIHVNAYRLKIKNLHDQEHVFLNILILKKKKTNSPIKRDSNISNESPTWFAGLSWNK